MKNLTQKLLKATLLSSLGMLVLSACGGSGSCNNCNNAKQPVAVDYQIDYVGVIPVVNGTATSSVFYVHNDGDSTLSGVSYSLSGVAKSISQSARLLAGADDIMDANGFILKSNSLKNCATIAAHSSCAIEFTAPAMSVGDQNNSLLQVSLIDANGFTHSYDQVLNYGYYSASLLASVDFAGAANVVANLGNKRYMTAYLVGGSGLNQIYDNVNLLIDNSGLLGISQGFITGQQIGAGEALAVEFTANLNSSGQVPVSVIPQYTTTPLAGGVKSALLDSSGSASGQGLFVNTSTNLDSYLGVKSGLVPLLKSGKSVLVYVSSFGVVGNLSITSSNPDVVISENSCANGLAANTSCSYRITATSDNVGSTIIKYTLPDSGGSIEQQTNFAPAVLPPDSVQTISNSPVANAGLLANQQSGVINYTFSNLGNSDLTDLLFLPVITGDVRMEIVSNSCGTRIVANSQCLVQVRLIAGTSGGSGTAYLELSGKSAGGKDYTTKSGVINYYVDASNLVVFSSPVGSTATLVVTGNNRESQSRDFVVQNNAATATAITAVNLTGINLPASLKISKNECSGSLAANSSCAITVSFGPLALESNISGIANLAVSSESASLIGTINYTGLGLDSHLLITNVTQSGFASGSGSSVNPYHALGCANSSPSITITYKNMSENYVAQNMALNIIDGHVAPYLSVDTGKTSCGYGADPKNLAVGASCDLVLTAAKSSMTTGSEFNLDVNYPSASWTTSQGFIQQNNFSYENSLTLFANYVQPALISTVDPMSGSSLTRTLTQSLVNADGCAAITTSVSSLAPFGVTAAPQVISGNCSVNGDASLSCSNDSSHAVNQIEYTLPASVPQGTDLFFLFGSSGSSSQQLWFNPALLLFKFGTTS